MVEVLRYNFREKDLFNSETNILKSCEGGRSEICRWFIYATDLGILHAG